MLCVFHRAVVTSDTKDRGASVDGLRLDIKGSFDDSSDNSRVSSVVPSPLSPSPRYGLLRADSFISISQESNNNVFSPFGNHNLPESLRFQTISILLGQDKKQDVVDIVNDMLKHGEVTAHFAQQFNATMKKTHPKNPSLDLFNDRSGRKVSLFEYEQAQDEYRRDMRFLETYTLPELQYLHDQLHKDSKSSWSDIGSVVKAIKKKQAEQAQN